MLAGHIGKYSRYEIEKKYLLKALPKDVPADFVEIQDRYLPNSSLRLRIERASDGRIIGRKLTKKDAAPDQGPATCVITSLYLSENDLKALGDLRGNELNKRRYYREDGKTRVSFDVFKGRLEGLILAEVEFLDHESCSSFIPKEQDWVEVTGDPKYSGGYLAINWRPELLGASLRLRPLVEEDFEALFAAASDPMIWEVHPERMRYKREHFEVYFRSAIDSKAAFVIIDLKSDRIIGSSRYINYDAAKSCVEIGYTFLTRNYWGGVHNRELKKLMMDYAFQFVDTIHFVVGKDNVRSRKAMAKLGGILMEDLSQVPATRDISASVVYRIMKSDWMSGTGR